MQELQIVCTKSVEAKALRPQMFAVVMKSISIESEDEVMNHKAYERAYETANCVTLMNIIEEVHTSGEKVRPKARKRIS